MGGYGALWGGYGALWDGYGAPWGSMGLLWVPIGLLWGLYGSLWGAAGHVTPRPFPPRSHSNHPPARRRGADDVPRSRGAAHSDSLPLGPAPRK